MRAAAALVLLALAGCLEPLPQFEATGTAEGKAKVAGCTPMTCTGCCAGDVCMGGNTDDACGYDGRECTACASTHRCEAPGACYPLPMSHTWNPGSHVPQEPFCEPVDGRKHCQ